MPHSNDLESQIDALVRDITSVEYMSKSEARRRITELLLSQKQELAEKSEKLASALLSMYDQYCATNGHLFMSAGEEASNVLEEYGYAGFDPAGRLLTDPT